jgi:hypothetical protein
MKENNIKNLILRDIKENLPKWCELDEESKLFNYIEFKLFLNQEFDLFSFESKKWNVVISKNIINDPDKLNIVKTVLTELTNGLSIWRRLPFSRISTYLELKNFKKRYEILNKLKNLKNEEESNSLNEEIIKLKKLEGKDILQMLFNIQHLRVNDNEISNVPPLNLFGEKIKFLCQKTNQLLFVMFDSKKSMAYFLDILAHEDLYKYNKLFNIILNENFPRPFHVFNDLHHDDCGWSDKELMKLMLNGANVFFNINKKATSLINHLLTSGQSYKVIRIYNSIIQNIPNDYYFPEFDY